MSKGDVIGSNFALFSAAVKGSDYLHFTPFHYTYYRVLDRFAKCKIKRLIVTIPPQHGKSEGSTRLLPAYLLGINPDLQIAIASYSQTFARKFNRAIQRAMDSEEYTAIFPETRLADKGRDSSTRTADEFEVVGRKGGLMVAGRGSSLTGNKVDIMILDDLYKDAMEGNSPVVREAVWEWYLSAVKTRLHNDSQELIVFTRWHDDDLIGRLEQNEKVVELTSFDDVDPQADCWYKLNFEAIKESEKTELDQRDKGAPLWPERHSLQMLEARRRLDNQTFETMYQGHPIAREGLLYGERWRTYDTLPSVNEIVKRANYTDTADMGDDYLCSISYVVDKGGKIYVTDVLYTRESMESTEAATAMLLQRTDTRIANIESNNGGRGFARAVQKLVQGCRVEWFHQSANKEARIMTNANQVIDFITWPSDWVLRWPTLAQHLQTYRRTFNANRWHDAADVVTGIIEKEKTVRGGKIAAFAYKQ